MTTKPAAPGTNAYRELDQKIDNSLWYSMPRGANRHAFGAAEVVVDMATRQFASLMDAGSASRDGVPYDSVRSYFKTACAVLAKGNRVEGRYLIAMRSAAHKALLNDVIARDGKVRRAVQLADDMLADSLDRSVITGTVESAVAHLEPFVV